MKMLFTLKVAMIFVLSTAFVGSGAFSVASPISQTAVVQSVYICGGPYATKFHSYSSCKGLNNCSKPIYSLNSQQTARDKGFSACKLCWKK